MRGIVRLKRFMTVALLLAASKAAPAQAPRVDRLGDPLPPGAVVRLGALRWRPSGHITQMVFAPGGTRFATWHSEHYTTSALTIWDVPTGRELRRIELPGAQMLSLHWLADGRGVGLLRGSEGLFLW